MLDLIKHKYIYYCFCAVFMSHSYSIYIDAGLAIMIASKVVSYFQHSEDSMILYVMPLVEPSN